MVSLLMMSLPDTCHRHDDERQRLGAQLTCEAPLSRRSLSSGRVPALGLPRCPSG